MVDGTECDNFITFKTEDKDLASMVISYYPGDLFPNEQYRVEQTHDKATKVYCFTGLEKEKLREFLGNYRSMLSLVDKFFLAVENPTGHPELIAMLYVCNSENLMFREMLNLESISREGRISNWESLL